MLSFELMVLYSAMFMLLRRFKMFYTIFGENWHNLILNAVCSTSNPVQLFLFHEYFFRLVVRPQRDRLTGKICLNVTSGLLTELPGHYNQDRTAMKGHQ